MEIPPMEAEPVFTDVSSDECRSRAEASFALAERGGAAREHMLIDGERWMLLADHLAFVETAMAGARHRRRLN
jgi:hypothetical protein